MGAVVALGVVAVELVLLAYMVAVERSCARRPVFGPPLYDDEPPA